MFRKLLREILEVHPHIQTAPLVQQQHLYTEEHSKIVDEARTKTSKPVTPAQYRRRISPKKRAGLVTCNAANVIDAKPAIVQLPWKKVDDLDRPDETTSKQGDDSEMTVLHWNILADRLSDSFPKVPQRYLDWDYRFRLIK